MVAVVCVFTCSRLVVVEFGRWDSCLSLPHVIISTYSFAQKKIISLCVGETFLCVIDLGIVYESIGPMSYLPR